MVLVVRRQPNPFEIVVVLAALAFGTILLVTPSSLRSTVTELLPSWEVTVFGACLTLGSLPVLLGLWWREPEGLRYEALGCTLTGAFMLAFAVLVIGHTGLSSASIFFLSLSTAFLVRTVQILLELRKLRTVVTSEDVAR